MIRKSIQAHLRMFIGVLVFLCGLYLLTLYFGGIVKIADATYHRILALEKDFSDVVIQERMVINRFGTDPMEDSHRKLREKAEEFGFREELPLLSACSRYFVALLQQKRNIDRKHQIVRELLPEMVESARYIHEHHLVYLKNLLRRGHVTQDWDMGEDFERSPVHSAPELETIRMAVNIQDRLLDVFSLFYRLLSRKAPSSLKEEFKTRLEAFYAAVNTFEDFSLDAQDGLLVEELLISGRLFEDAFTVLLDENF